MCVYEHRGPAATIGHCLGWLVRIPSGGERNTDKETSTANAVSDNVGESRFSDASRLDHWYDFRRVIVSNHVLSRPVKHLIR